MTKIRFADVIGVDEAKEELQEIVGYLKNPSKFRRLGGKLPTGCLLLGPPGTGKTMLAKAIAGEAGVPFFFSSGSDFEEMFVGVGARRMRDLFDAAKKSTPCIVFIDEIDAVGGSRHLKERDSMKMTLNQLLTEMDGFEPNDQVIVIGATNYAENLDAALLRPGRFDKQVTVPLPDVRGRKKILEHYCKDKPMADDVDLLTVARGTPGMSGADLFNLVNEAAIRGAVQNLSQIDHATLEWARDKVQMGPERRSAYITKENSRLTAFHEGGHALVAHLTEGADPIHKATIMPRGQALGLVMQLPTGDQTSISRKQLLAKLDVAMAGRVAEELVFGKDNASSGASSDIKYATNIARRMVEEWGYSDTVGMRFVDAKSGMGSELRGKVDQEVQKLLDESYERAKQILVNHRGQLDLLANSLVEHETLTGPQIKQLLDGGKLSLKPLA